MDTLTTIYTILIILISIGQCRSKEGASGCTRPRAHSGRGGASTLFSHL